MTTTHTIQLAQPGEATYNPDKPLPHPIAVHDDGRCDRHHWVDEGDVLVGFQPAGDEQKVTLFRGEWLQDLDAAVGMYPVFSNSGGLYALQAPVTEVHRFTPQEA